MDFAAGNGEKTSVGAEGRTMAAAWVAGKHPKRTAAFCLKDCHNVIVVGRGQQRTIRAERDELEAVGAVS